MAKDQRLYAKFTLDFPEHEKVLPLSDAAFRCLIEATIWSRKQQTDGWLARRLALAKWSLEALKELSTNDTENPSLIDGKDGFDGWYIHDFPEHQDTKTEIEARRERNKLAGQKGGLAKGKQSAKQPASESLSENLAETETETETERTSTKERPRKRGARLTPEWMPDQTSIDAIRTECPHVDLKAEHRKFIDYWTDKTGRDATKLSWDGTWRNWMRRARENRPRAPTPNGHNGHDAKVDDYLAFANQSHQPEIEQ